MDSPDLFDSIVLTYITLIALFMAGGLLAIAWTAPLIALGIVGVVACIVGLGAIVHGVRVFLYKRA